jgi:hypothetical protein
MLFDLQKTVKSIQRHLHEFRDEVAGGGVFEPVTAGWTHARASSSTHLHELMKQRAADGLCARAPASGAALRGTGLLKRECMMLSHMTTARWFLYTVDCSSRSDGSA